MASITWSIKNQSANTILYLFNHYLKGNSLEIEPIDNIVSDKSLKRTRFDFGYVIPDYEKMVAELAAWMRQHKNLYPHYDIAD